ncbi:hypothetical protein Tco_1064744 [Tanacetum coccineum]
MEKTTFTRFKRKVDVDISDDAKKRKGKVVEMDDVSRVSELFWDVKRSTQYLIKYQAATEEEDESNIESACNLA